MNREEVRIQFTASANGLDEIYKKINEIKSAPNIKLDDKLLGQLKDLENKVPSLINKIKNTMAQEEFSIIDVQVLDHEFKQVEKIINSTITNLGKANLPAAINEQINQAKQQIAKAGQELAQVNKAIKDKQKKLDSSTASGLTDKEAAKVAKAEGAKFELGNQAFGNNFNEYVKSYRELEKQGKLTTQMQEDFKLNTEILAPAFQKVKDSVQNEIEAEKARIPAIQQSIEAGMQHIENLREQTASNDSLSEEEKQVAQAIIEASNASTKAKTAERNAVAAATQKTKENTQTTEKNTTAQQKNTGTVAKAAKQVFTYGTVLSAFRKIYRTVTQTIKDMDKALTDMAVVTNMSREDTKQLIGEFQNLAYTTGKTSTEIANMTTKFLQQGKSISQALQLTEAAAKAATIAGISGEQSINLLTNAMNGFQMSANKAMEVSDKFAALAASAATDYEELATALSKVAAQANLAGMSMDFTLGMLTKGIEVTREAPETIGTALKTVIARMRELTDYGATLEDGVDVNRVAKALDNIGVSLMDTNGQFRDLELVLTEVGQKWDTLNKNQQANVAVALAGTRQQSRLIAMMQDFDRTLELVDISANSYGATLAQSEKYMGGLEAAQNRLTTATQALITSLVDSDIIITMVDWMAGLVQTADVILNEWNLIVPIMVIAGLMLTNMLATKMAEVNLKRQDRLEEEKAKLAEMNHWSKQEMQAKKKDVAQKKDIKNQKKTALNDAKKLLKEKQITLEDKKQSILNDKTLTEEEKSLQIKLAEMDAQGGIAQAEQDVAKAQQEYNTANQEYLTANAELSSMKAQQLEYSAKALQVQTLQNSQAGILGGLFNAILIPLQLIQTTMTIINAVQTIFNALKNKEIGLHNKNAAAVTKEGVAKQISAGWGMAGSASAIPYVGWVIAIGIIAAVIGMMIAAAVQAGNTGDKTEDSIAKTREELNKLQADLYNLNTARKNVSKLGDEFESLSDKVIKTTEDIERMNEIVQSVNDEAGFERINIMADAETQLAQIKGYEASLQRDVDEQIAKINDKLIEGYKDIAYDEIMVYDDQGNPRAVQKFNQAEANKYMEALQEDQAFVNSIRTIGMQSIGGLSNVSAATSDAVLDILVNNIDSVFSAEKGVDTAAFQQMFAGESGWASFVSQLDKTMQDGSFSAYADMYDNIKQAADAGSEAAKKQLDALSEAVPMFGAMNKMGSKAIRTFDSLGYGAEEMNSIMITLTKTTQLYTNATNAADKSAEKLAKITEKLHQVNEDGKLTEEQLIENRREVYKQLVAEQLAAQQEASNILAMSEEEQRAAAEAGNEYAQQYIAALDAQKKALEQQKQAETDLAAEKNKNKPDQNKIEELENEISEADAAYGQAQNTLDDFNDIANNSTSSIEELKELLGTVSVTEITEEFTKLASAMERISKVTDLANLSISEQMELLADYPELLSAMEKGFLTAEESAKFWEETVKKGLKDADVAQHNMQTVYDVGTDKISSSKNWTGGWSELFNEESETGKQLRQQLASAGKLSIDDEFVAMLYSAKINDLIAQYQQQDPSLTLEQATAKAKSAYSKNDALTAASNIQADVQAYNQYDIMETRYEQEGITAFLDEESKEAWKNAQNIAAANRAKIDSYNEELETLEVGSDRYKEIMAQRNDALVKSLQDSEKETADIQNRIDKILGKGTENDLSAYVNMVDGIAYLNEETTKNLTETEKDKLAAVIKSLNAQGELYQDAMERRKKDQETLAQAIIDSEAKILEAQIENLEKRQEAYEEYFDAVDRFNEEEERTATMEDITNQLAALAGGSDAATNSLRKELMTQMEDLRKEEEEARREAAREALINDIEQETEQVNEKLDTVNDSINNVIQAIIATGAGNVEVITNDDGSVKLMLNGKEFKPYATGGLVDYTGPAMVHGSPEKPEAFLSAQDTKNMQMLFAALDEVFTKSTIVNAVGDTNNTNNVVVENVNITTNELNNEQDFRSAGQIFAEEFGKAIRQRGLNINVRK